jgi:hypothetical protein
VSPSPDPDSWASQSDLLIPAYGVHHRTDAPLDQIVAALQAGDWPLYVLPGAPTDKEGFVAAVRDVLPLDPPVQSAHWDALSDSLWEGIHELRVEKVAIVWPDSDRMRRANGEDYTTAVEILTDLVFGLADPKFTVDHVTRLLVYLA